MASPVKPEPKKETAFPRHGSSAWHSTCNNLYSLHSSSRRLEMHKESPLSPNSERPSGRTVGVASRKDLQQHRHAYSGATDDCPFLVIPDCVVFDKVIQGTTYTKKVVLRNREKVGRRLRLEVDPQSPFRISPLKYPADEALIQPTPARSGEQQRSSRVSGIVATGMRVQVWVSFTPTPETPEARGVLELHTEKGSFAVPVVARKEPPLLVSLPRFLNFKAVRPGEVAVLELPLRNGGGEAVLRPLVVPADTPHCSQSVPLSLDTGGTSVASVVAGKASAEAAASPAGYGIHHRLEGGGDEAFEAVAQVVLLPRGHPSASLWLRFFPRRPGHFVASLLLVSAGSPGEEIPCLGRVELKGFAEGAALTLKDFCGVQWPAGCLPGLFAGLCPSLAIDAQCAADALVRSRLFMSEEAAPTGGTSAAVVTPTETQTGAAIAGVKRGDFSCRYFDEDMLPPNEISIIRAITYWLPRRLDFGSSLRGGPPIIRTVTLCNEGRLPIRVQWRCAAAAATATATAVEESYTTASEAFSVSPPEAVLLAQSCVSFSFAVDPRLLSPSASPLPWPGSSTGTSSSSSSSSREGISKLFSSAFSLWIVGISRRALLSPRVLLTHFETPPCTISDAQQQQHQHNANSETLLQWFPLLLPLQPEHSAAKQAESEDANSLKAAEKTDEGLRDWQLLLLQQRVTLEAPKVRVYAPSQLQGGPFALRLRPAAIQTVPFRLKNEGGSQIRMAVHRNLRSLKVKWRRPQGCCCSSRGNNSNNSSSNPITGEYYNTAWLLHVEDNEMEGLEGQKDAVFGYGPQPFGFFSLCAKGGGLIPPQTDEQLLLRLLPLCCGTISFELPLSVFPPQPADTYPKSAAPEQQAATAAGGTAAAAAGDGNEIKAATATAKREADAEEQLRVTVPFSVEVTVPTVTSHWPPQLNFGTVRAHSRTSRGLLVVNTSQDPAVVRVRIPAAANNCSASTDTDLLQAASESTAAAFPCHLASSLVRAPTEDPPRHAAAAGASAASPRTTTTLTSTPVPTTAKSAGSVNSTEGTITETTATAAAAAAVAGRPGASTAAGEESAIGLPSCVGCLCIDESLRSAEPFFCNPLKAAADAAAAAAEAAAAAAGAAAAAAADAEVTAGSPIAAAEGRAVEAEEFASVQQQQQLALQKHLLEWKFQQELAKQQQQRDLLEPQVVTGLSGQLVVYPSHALLPPGGAAVFLVTLRASHPQALCSFLFLETLEGSELLPVAVEARTALPLLRLSSHHLQLPPLFLLQPRLLHQKLTLYNDGDISVKVRWSSPTPLGTEQTRQQPEQQQKQLQQQQVLRSIAPVFGGNRQGGLLLSLSPAEFVLFSHSSRTVEITCVGLCVSPHLEARAYCSGQGLLLPLQVSFVAACSGASITYALFSQQELKTAEALLLQAKFQQQQSPRKQQEHPSQSPQSQALNLVQQPQEQQNQTEEPQQQREQHHEYQHVPQSTRNENMRDIARGCLRPQTANAKATSAGSAAALKGAGIGHWGSLQQQGSGERHAPEAAEELRTQTIAAGGESVFLYLLAVNNSPIPAFLQLQAFTHGQMHQNDQQLLPQQQRQNQQLKHPTHWDDGRPAGAFTCNDCNSSNRNSSNGRWESTGCSSSSSRGNLSAWIDLMDSCSTARTDSSSRSSSSCSSSSSNKNSSRCCSRSTTSSNSSRALMPSQTAEALLLQAASCSAPVELRQLVPGAFGVQRPSFKATSGVRTLHAAAARQRRRRLQRTAPGGLVLISHPESRLLLQQHQAVLLAIEMFAAVPADFSAVLQLCLEPCQPQLQHDLQQLQLRVQQHSQQYPQQEVAIIPLKVPARGPLLLLPPLQQRLRPRSGLPPLVTAEVMLQQQNVVAREQQQQLQQKHLQIASLTSYRKGGRLIPLKPISYKKHTPVQAAGTTNVQQRQQELLVQQQQEDEEQSVMFKVENNTNQWLRVQWLLYDMGLWEIQQQLQQQLQQVATLKDLAVEVLRRRAIDAAREAVAAEAAAEAAQAAAAAAAAAAPVAPVAAVRKPLRSQQGKAPDTAALAAAAAAAAAVAAEEASMKAAEAAAAAASAGIVEAIDGWQALAVADASAATVAAPAATVAAPAAAVAAAAAATATSDLRGAASPTDPQMRVSGDRQRYKDAVEKAATANAGVSKEASTSAAATTSADVGLQPATAAVATKGKTESEESEGLTPELLEGNESGLVPPEHCLVTVATLLSHEARPVAAAAAVLASLQPPAVPVCPQPLLQSAPQGEAGCHTANVSSSLCQAAAPFAAVAPVLLPAAIPVATAVAANSKGGKCLVPAGGAAACWKTAAPTRSSDASLAAELSAYEEGCSSGSMRGSTHCSVQLELTRKGSLDIRPTPCGAAGSAAAVASAAASGGEVLFRRPRETALGGRPAASTAAALNSASVPKEFVVPCVEPSPCLIAPYGLAEMSLRCGCLLLAPGTHRLRAVALAEPVPADIARREAARSAGAARAAPTHAAPASCLTPPSPHQGSSATGIRETAAAANSASPDSPATASDIAGAVSVCDVAVAAPVACAAVPLVIDFNVRTLPPNLRMLWERDHSSAAASDTEAAAAAEANEKGEAAPRTGDLGTLWFAARECINDNGNTAGTAGSALAATPLRKELLLQPARHCATVRCAVSVTGNAFKLVKAELLQQQQQQQPQQQQQHQEQQQPQELPLGKQVAVTIQRKQQLRLVVEFSLPFEEAKQDGEHSHCSKVCCGELSVTFPETVPPSWSNEDADLARLLLSLTRQAMHQLQHHQLVTDSDEPLCEPLLCGMLRLLRPQEDPRAFLSLGLAALRQQQQQDQQTQQQQQRLQVKAQQEQQQEEQTEHSKRLLQLLRCEKLVHRLDLFWPVASEAAAAGLAARGAVGPSTTFGYFGRSALARATPPAPVAALGVARSATTQVVSLIGACRKTIMLLWAPPLQSASAAEEAVEVKSFWATYRDPRTPLLIDFGTTHIQARRRPCRLLQLRAVSTAAVSWQLSACRSSSSKWEFPESEQKPPTEGSPDRAFVLTEETKVGEVEAFVFCPSEGTLPCFLAADASSRSCSSRHSCEAGATIRIYFVPPHVGLHFCLFRLSADFAPHQFVALRGVATTDEAFDVSANLGFSEAHYPVNSTP